MNATVDMTTVTMPVAEVTNAIVTAAKRVRKPKVIVEVSIVDQIVENLRNGTFAEEAVGT